MKELHGYWDRQLIFLLKYGFPLDFDTSNPLRSTLKNHSSAVLHKDHVENYLKEEVAEGAILGPFSNPPIENLHVSPFLSREKPGSTKRRIIVDLSYPPAFAVNSNIKKDVYLDTPFLLTLPTVDHIAKKIISLGRGSHICKADISRAFRHLRIDPKDCKLLGLKCDSYYMDLCLPFGFRHGTAIFQRCTDAIRFILNKKGIDSLNYVDDICLFSTVSGSNHKFKVLQEVLKRLGFDLSEKKLVPPSVEVSCLGIVFNTEEFTMRIPDEKLRVIMSRCIEWGNKYACTKRELQSF